MSNSISACRLCSEQVARVDALDVERALNAAEDMRRALVQIAHSGQMPGKGDVARLTRAMHEIVDLFVGLYPQETDRLRRKFAYELPVAMIGNYRENVRDLVRMTLHWAENALEGRPSDWDSETKISKAASLR